MANQKGRTSSSSSESARDYVGIAISYAKAAVKDRAGRKHGKLLRLGAQRFLDDLKRAKRKGCGFHFDEWSACDACGFIESLPHVEGKWDTPTIVLHPSQVLFLVQLFGFRKADGTRRFTSALFAVARKNGKSTLAAGIMLYCQCCENEEGAQLISAATTFDQSRKVWDPAKRMVEKTPDLREAFGLEVFAKSIARMEIGASFKPINAKASTQDGLNPSHTALDEIHAHKSPDLLNVMTSAAGARANPLWLYTTTEGYTNPGPWAEIRQFAKQLLDSVFEYEADHFLALFFAVDEGDDEFDEAVWIKANPLMDANPHLLSAIRKEAVEAKAMPSKMAEFRIKRLNRPSSVADGWIDLGKWKQCDGEVDLEFLTGKPCTAAFDLASTTDLTAWRIVWFVDGVWYTFGRRWAPDGAIRQRTERGTVPYASWVESGHLTPTDGEVTDYAKVEADIREDIERFKPTVIAYDRWNAQELSNRLIDDGFNIVEFIQGTKSYHPAMQEMERAYISGKLRHGGDPVLHWCASNIVARKDVNLNMAPDKKKSAEKIDDICALLMAIGVSLSSVAEEEPSYQIMFV